MNIWRKLKDSIHPEDEDGPFDDEFDDDYPGTGMNNGMGSDMGDFGGSYSVSGNPYGNTSQNLNSNSAQTSPNYQYQQPAQPATSTPINSSLSISGNDMKSSVEIKVIKPENFDSVARIAELLMNKKMIVLNLEETNKEIGRRLLDFLKGVCFAIGGQVKPASEKTWILTPNNASITSDAAKNEENGERRDSGGY